MKKYVLISFLTLCCASLLSQTTAIPEQDGDSMVPESCISVPYTRRYSISLLGMYGYNHTWSHYGGFDLKGHIPICRFFEADAAFEYNSGGVCALTAVARPMFPLPVGELFLDGAIHSRFFLSPYDMAWLTMAASIGYRMDYVSFQFGIMNNSLIDISKGASGATDIVAEPVNFLYRIAVNVRPYNYTRWNITLGTANYTDYEYERTWESILFIHSYYNIRFSRCIALLDVDFKPSGAFHLNAQFWGVMVRAGFKYYF